MVQARDVPARLGVRKEGEWAFRGRTLHPRFLALVDTAGSVCLFEEAKVHMLGRC